MTKFITFLAWVILCACTVGMAQKRSSSSPKIASGSSCAGPVTMTGKNGLQTCRSGSSSQPSSGSTGANSTVPTNSSVLGRLASRKLANTIQRPGTPDFVPTTSTISNSQLP
jgi:hypothetical protein